MYKKCDFQSFDDLLCLSKVFKSQIFFFFYVASAKFYQIHFPDFFKPPSITTCCIYFSIGTEVLEENAFSFKMPMKRHQKDDEIFSEKPLRLRDEKFPRVPNSLFIFEQSSNGFLEEKVSPVLLFVLFLFIL